MNGSWCPWSIPLRKGLRNRPYTRSLRRDLTVVVAIFVINTVSRVRNLVRSSDTKIKTFASKFWSDIRVIFYVCWLLGLSVGYEDGGNIFFRNIGKLLSDYMVSSHKIYLSVCIARSASGLVFQAFQINR
jgi:hypothetical protein